MIDEQSYGIPWNELKEKEIQERASYLLELTQYFENRLVPYEYRQALIEFLEVVANGTSDV